VTVNLATGAASGGEAQGDTLSASKTSRRRLRRHAHCDAGDNVLTGGDGNDTLVAAPATIR